MLGTVEREGIIIIDIARRMLARGGSIEDIADVTGLPVTEICNLRH